MELKEELVDSIAALEAAKAEAVDTVNLGDFPSNLPTASAVPGYLDAEMVEEASVDETVEEVKDIEDRAHSRYTLLSSDAIRYFINTNPDSVTRLSKLDEVIDAAKAAYPSEDGWLVLNLSRIQEVVESEQGGETAFKSVGEVIQGSGSLAEAILSGNMKLALELIEKRPMVSLADATADLDAVHRLRQGLSLVEVPVSELLKEEAEKFSLEKLEMVIKALASALDGTYSNETDAVKAAVMKAVSVVLNR